VDEAVLAGMGDKSPNSQKVTVASEKVLAGMGDQSPNSHNKS